MVRKRVRAESRARYYIREESQKRGWNTSHVSSGGDLLEENEIVAYFPEIGLRLNKPDFLFCLNGEPVVVIEAKNQIGLIEDGINEAIAYAEQINKLGRYRIKIAVGAAGQDDTGFTVEVRYLSSSGWAALKSHDYELTTIPTKREVELAYSADDGTTSVSIPASYEFIDAAIKISSILRTAKIEAPLRPKVIGAIVLAMYQGTIDLSEENVLNSINNLINISIASAADITDFKKAKLIDALTLSKTDFDRLTSSIRRVVSILRRLNIRAVLQTDTDFLGMFYEAFLRYGYDNNALGIVFTPRHITRFCVDLIGATTKDRVIDIACGTGGFLVAAFDSMISTARGSASIAKVKASITGFDTNPTVWALTMLNMFFRGDGKSHIELGSCFEINSKNNVEGKFTRAFLNPPFSQDEEPEKDFIDTAMAALEPEGILAAVVHAGIFADDRHKNWRKQFLRKHTLLAMISLPEDLFYPTAAPTSIVITQAHVPTSLSQEILMARVWNDGYEKLKNRRIERVGSQLPEVKRIFDLFLNQDTFSSEVATTITGFDIKNGEEWSPQNWLPQPVITLEEIQFQQKMVIMSIYQAVAEFLELADEVLDDFTSAWMNKQALPTGMTGKVIDFFEVVNSRSTGEKNYVDGTCPYISSGEAANSIIRLVSAIDSEYFEDGGITVTAFGNASVQPWGFIARGNGGSSVRVLIPKYNMSFRELVWFAAQINLQKWRFFYARMSIKSRLEKLDINTPLTRLSDGVHNIAHNIKNFCNTLNNFSLFM